MRSKLVNITKKWLLPGLLLSLATIIYFNCYDYLSLAAIKQYYGDVQQWTNLHYETAVFLYMLIFIILVACTIPCATVLALLGGFLFGLEAVIYAVISTTLGAILLYYTVRTSFGYKLAEKSSGRLKKLEQGFRKNAFNYLLVLRLTPIIPCWISNITAGLLNVPFKTFVIATLIGIFPSTLIYVLLGQGLDKLIANDQFSFASIVFSPATFFPLLGLAFISIVPIIYKGVKKNKEKR